MASPKLTLMTASTLLAVAAACLAESARELVWEDLLPSSLPELEGKADALQQTLSKLTSEERDRYQLVARELLAREKLAASVAESELSVEERRLLAEKPSDTYPNALAFWTKVKNTKAQLSAQNAAVDPAIDGERVRIPGYVLPLEFDGSQIREFLLVPFVGACIHVPPPPANQMVFVEADESFKSEGLYTPVWVEGTISTRGGTHALSLVDGQAPVEAGYSLRASKVEPYE